LARDRGATIVIAHCQEDPVAYGGGEFAFAPPVSFDRELEMMLDNVSAKADDVPCEKRMLRGDPWKAIVELAQNQNVSLIVMGTHGRTGLMRLLMGSVAEAVVRHATCPVLAIRQPVHVAEKVP
jgi:nucleotide-binding universal stress UspA family protein